MTTEDAVEMNLKTHLRKAFVVVKKSGSNYKDLLLEISAVANVSFPMNCL